MKIGGLQKLTLVDYPNKIAATVFLTGCNFKCGFCHNAGLVDVEKMKNQPEIKESDFFNFLKFLQALKKYNQVSRKFPRDLIKDFILDRLFHYNYKFRHLLILMPMQLLAHRPVF